MRLGILRLVIGSISISRSVSLAASALASAFARDFDVGKSGLAFLTPFVVCLVQWWIISSIWDAKGLPDQCCCGDESVSLELLLEVQGESERGNDDWNREFLSIMRRRASLGSLAKGWRSHDSFLLSCSATLCITIRWRRRRSVWNSGSKYDDDHMPNRYARVCWRCRLLSNEAPTGLNTRLDAVLLRVTLARGLIRWMLVNMVDRITISLRLCR